MSRQKATNSAGFGHTQVVCPRFLLFCGIALKHPQNEGSKKGTSSFLTKSQKGFKQKCLYLRSSVSSGDLRASASISVHPFHPETSGPSPSSQINFSVISGAKIHAKQWAARSGGLLDLMGWQHFLFGSKHHGTARPFVLPKCTCTKLFFPATSTGNAFWRANCSEGVMAVNWIQTDRWLVCCPETSIAAPTTFSACSCLKNEARRVE